VLLLILVTSLMVLRVRLIDLKVVELGCQRRRVKVRRRGRRGVGRGDWRTESRVIYHPWNPLYLFLDYPYSISRVERGLSCLVFDLLWSQLWRVLFSMLCRVVRATLSLSERVLIRQSKVVKNKATSSTSIHWISRFRFRLFAPYSQGCSVPYTRDITSSYTRFCIRSASQKRDYWSSGSKNTLLSPSSHSLSNYL